MPRTARHRHLRGSITRYVGKKGENYLCLAEKQWGKILILNRKYLVPTQ